jgi:hypothetical protein
VGLTRFGFGNAARASGDQTHCWNRMRNEEILIFRPNRRVLSPDIRLP